MPVTNGFVKRMQVESDERRRTIDEGLKAKAYSRVLDISDARIRW